MNVCFPRLDEQCLSLLIDFIFMHDNAPVHCLRATEDQLEILGFIDDNSMMKPQNYPDLNIINNILCYHQQENPR